MERKQQSKALWTRQRMTNTQKTSHRNGNFTTQRDQNISRGTCEEAPNTSCCIHPHHKKKVIEKAIGFRLTNQECTNIGKHKMYPSAHKPVPPKHIFHGQVSEKALLHLLAMLEKPDSLQRYAFGVQMIEIERGVKASSEDSMGWEIIAFVDVVIV